MRTILIHYIFLISFTTILAYRCQVNRCQVDGIRGGLAINETASVPGKCIKVTCNPGLGLSAVGCALKVKENCHLGETDYSKPYPACCPDFICP